MRRSPRYGITPVWPRTLVERGDADRLWLHFAAERGQLWPDGFNGQSVFFDNGYEAGKIDDLLLISRLGLPLIKNLPRRVGSSLAALASTLTVRSQSLDRKVPFVHDIPSSKVIEYKIGKRR